MSSVTLHPYTLEWPASFLQRREELLSAFSPDTFFIEHIGSTAIPGMVAKPVIDILLGASSLSDIEEKIPSLEKLGYVYVSKYEREIPTRRYFVKSPPNSFRVHVHGVVLNSPTWQEHLRFRDALRANALLASEYATLKSHLAQTYADDKSAYTDAKAPFIRSAISDTNIRQ